jgi:hypothetical protein
MHRACTAGRTGMILAIAAAMGVCGGCPAPTEPSSLETTPVLRDTRQLRVVMIALDANADGEAFVSDGEELTAATPGVVTAHRVIVRDSSVTSGLIAFADGGEQVELPLEEGCDLRVAGSLGRLRRELAERFPAEREVLILTGHGRDWRGFGLRDGEDEAVLSPSELAGALADPGGALEPLLVLDTPWSASGEVLTPLSEVAATIVVAPGPRPPGGIDYQDAFSRLPGGTEGDDVAGHLATAMAADGCPAGVVLTPAALAALPGTIGGLGEAGTVHLSTAAAQEELQSALIRDAECLAVPGAAVVTIGTVATLLSHPVDAGLTLLYLYLTDVDRDGVPLGHRIDYRAEDVGSGLAPAFRSLGWAPDYLAQIGFLYRLWYSQF